MTCPYCSASPAVFTPVIDEGETKGLRGEQRTWQPAACPACGGLVVAELSATGGAIKNIEPQELGEWKVDHLPEAIGSIWDEAVTVFRVGAQASAVVACGRVLEASADTREVQGKTLQERIERMQKEGVITREFRDAMDYVRLIRNVGAHAGQDVSQESAEGTMRFTLQMLRLLFEVPTELSRLTGHPPELQGEEEQS